MVAGDCWIIAAVFSDCKLDGSQLTENLIQKSIYYSIHPHQ